MITEIIKKITEISLIAVILFLIAVIGYSEASLPSPKCRQFEFTYETTVKDIPQNAKEIRIWIPYPHDTACQKISDVSIVGVSDYRIYQRGENKFLFVDIREPKSKDINFSLRYNVRRDENMHKAGFSKAVKKARGIYD